MPTMEWLKAEFVYGYESGDVLSWFPNRVRRSEERKCGGSYRKIALQALRPYVRPDSKVLELGPGKGSWSRAILRFIPCGELHTIDFQDVTKWLCPDQYQGRLVCHQVADNALSSLPNGYFDFFWSFGVLCHNEVDAIKDILASARAKMRKGAWSVHQYGDWNKLDRYGWRKGQVPEEFQAKPDKDIWWPRNDRVTMARIAKEAGWEVVTPDLELMKRDAMILLRNP